MPGAKWRMGGEQAHAGMRNEDEDVEGHAWRAKNTEEDTEGHGKGLAEEGEEAEKGSGPESFRVRFRNQAKFRNADSDVEGHASRGLRNEDEDTEGHVSRVK